MAFSGAFVKPFRPAFDAGLAAAAVPWYLAGGAPTPIAVYQPKGAADLAASYVNLANPGTYNAAPGTAPTFDAATGWVFNGTTQHLTTGVVPASGFSILARYSDVVTKANGTEQWIVGTWKSGARFGLIASAAIKTQVGYRAGGVVDVTPNLLTGVLAVAGQQGYRNGVADGAAISAWTTTTTTGIYIGAENSSGSAVDFTQCKILAIAIWDTSTNHATWMPAVMAAVALI